jgi:hypothetical protein
LRLNVSRWAGKLRFVQKLMSTDFIGLFNLAVPGATPEWLMRLLNDNPAVFGEVVERYQRYWSVKSWSIQVPPPPCDVELVGPGGFAFRFRYRVIEVYHLIPFNVFACDAVARTQLRRVWHFVAKVLGSPCAIYTHELMPHEGANLNEIENGLRNRIGPPADSFVELCGAEFFGPKAWYIDNFVDFAQTENAIRA